jgi:hypothetical protein
LGELEDAWNRQKEFESEKKCCDEQCHDESPPAEPHPQTGEGRH